MARSQPPSRRTPQLFRSDVSDSISAHSEGFHTVVRQQHRRKRATRRGHLRGKKAHVSHCDGRGRQHWQRQLYARAPRRFTADDHARIIRESNHAQSPPSIDRSASGHRRECAVRLAVAGCAVVARCCCCGIAECASFGEPVCMPAPAPGTRWPCVRAGEAVDRAASSRDM